MSKIEIEIEEKQIEIAKKRLNTLGIHKSPVKNRGRKGINTTKSNSKKRNYSKNVTIQNNINSPEWKKYISDLKNRAGKRDRYSFS